MLPGTDPLDAPGHGPGAKPLWTAHEESTHPNRESVRMASSLNPDVASCHSHVAPAERAGIVATTPAQMGCRTCESDPPCRFRLRIPHEAAHDRRGEVADDHVDVLRQHCHGSDAKPRPLRGGTDSGDDDRHVRLVDGELPPPGMPGDVRLQAGSRVSPPVLHDSASHGWVHAGATPRRSWSATPWVGVP